MGGQDGRGRGKGGKGIGRVKLKASEEKREGERASTEKKGGKWK